MHRSIVFKIISLLILQIGSLCSTDWTAYVTIDDAGPLVPIDVATSTPGNTIALPGSQIFSEAISPDGSTIYMVASDSVVVVDAATRTVIAQASYSLIPIPLFAGSGIAMAPDGATAYITGFSGSSGFIVPFITADNVFGSSLEFISSGGSSVMNNITITPDGSTAFVIPRIFADSIIPIDLTNQLVGSPITLEGFAALFTIIAAPDGSSVYMSGGSRLLQVDVATLSFVTDINLPFDITAFIISPDGTTAYITDDSSTAIHSLDLAAQQVSLLASIDFFQPNFIAITPDGKTIYAVGGASNPVVFIDVATQAMGAPINVLDGTYVLFGPTLMNSPTNLQGKQIKNRFIDRTAFANVLTWNLPTSGVAPVSYNIYRDSLSNLIGTSKTLGFIDYYILPSTTHTYYVRSVSESGAASAPVNITIAP